MARSHICQGCGWDLAGVRAPPDPHYRLPVVVCPRCGLACVRRPYGGAARARNARRGLLTALTIMMRTLLLVLVPAVMSAASAAIASALDSALLQAPASALLNPDARARARLLGWWQTDGLLILPGWLFGALGIGFVVGLLFHHWRVRWTLLGLALVVGAALLLPPPMVAAAEHAERGVSFTKAWAQDLPPTRDLILFGIPFLPSAAISLATMPAGQRIGRKYTTGRGLRSAKLKKARNKRRIA